MTLLEQFFYWAGITYRYRSATESKIAEDLVRMDAIVGGKHPSYPLAELEVSAERIIETDFRAGNAFCKTILCLLACLAQTLSQRLGYQVRLNEPFYTNGCTTLSQCVFPTRSYR
jgi:hypothetical protein